jgi:hypothetical protein
VLPTATWASLCNNDREEPALGNKETSGAAHGQFAITSVRQKFGGKASANRTPSAMKGFSPQIRRAGGHAIFFL